MAKSKLLVTSGQCSYMLTICMIQKIRGTGEVLRSGLLVSVSPSIIDQLTLWWLKSCRPSSTSSPRRVRLTKNPRQRNLGMHAFTTCALSPKLHWLTLPLRYVSLLTYIAALIWVNTGPIFSYVRSSFLSYRSSHRFRAFLQQYLGSLGWSWWKGWSRSIIDLVESVGWFHFSGYQLINLQTNLSPLYWGWTPSVCE